MSPRRDGGPDRNPQLTVVATIFGVAGAVALVVALVASLAVVAVFGVIALVIAAVVYSLQRVRERSAVETEQTLGTGPLLSYSERGGSGSGPSARSAGPVDDGFGPPRRSAADEDEDEDEDEDTYYDDEDEPEPELRSISEEDDGTGARPGDQAAANVGAATATDIDADPHTGQPLSATTTSDPGDDDGPLGTRDSTIPLRVRRSHGSADETTGRAHDEIHDAEIVDDADHGPGHEAPHGEAHDNAHDNAHDGAHDAEAHSGNHGAS